MSSLFHGRCDSNGEPRWPPLRRGAGFDAAGSLRSVVCSRRCFSDFLAFFMCLDWSLLLTQINVHTARARLNTAIVSGSSHSKRSSCALSFRITKHLLDTMIVMDCCSSYHSTADCPLWYSAVGPSTYVSAVILTIGSDYKSFLSRNSPGPPTWAWEPYFFWYGFFIRNSFIPILHAVGWVIFFGFLKRTSNSSVALRSLYSVSFKVCENPKTGIHMFSTLSQQFVCRQ